MKLYPAIPGHKHTNTRIFSYRKNEIIGKWRKLYNG
jgi:hypothetical protein